MRSKIYYYNGLFIKAYNKEDARRKINKLGLFVSYNKLKKIQKVLNLNSLKRRKKWEMKV